MTPISDLIKKLTTDEIKATAYEILEAFEFPVASWAKGAVVRTIIAVFAAVASSFTEVQIAITKSGFLDWAEEDWLDVVADQVYGVTRIPATFADGFVTLTNGAGGSFSYGVGAFKVYNPTTKKVYRNSEAFTLAIGPGTTATFAIEAVEIGAASTSAATTITGMETPLLGVTCSNAAAVIGVDAETDPLLRVRCRLKLGALSPNGPAAAYEYIARSSDLNGGVVVTKTRVVVDSDLGEMTLLVAGPSGPISSGDVDLIQDAIDRLATPLGFDCTVESAEALTVNVAANVWFYSSLGMTTDEVETAIEEHVTLWLAGLPIGGDRVADDGFVYVSRVLGEVQDAESGEIAVELVTATMVSPTVDTAVDGNQVVAPGTITITATQVTAP